MAGGWGRVDAGAVGGSPDIPWQRSVRGGAGGAPVTRVTGAVPVVLRDGNGPGDARAEVADEPSAVVATVPFLFGIREKEPAGHPGPDLGRDLQQETGAGDVEFRLLLLVQHLVGSIDDGIEVFGLVLGEGGGDGRVAAGEEDRPGPA